MKFQFSNVVVVECYMIGVVVKSWEDKTYDVYVRSLNAIVPYKEESIQHYVYHKELVEDEFQYYPPSQPKEIGGKE